MRLMPLSIARWIAFIHSASSDPPHIQPPIAQVPSPTRPRGTGTFSQLIVSMSIRSNYTIFACLREMVLMPGGDSHGYRAVGKLVIQIEQGRHSKHESR